MKNRILKCPNCGIQLDVGDEELAVVVLCFVNFYHGKGSIWSCPQEQWGSPRTRVECASETDANVGGEIKHTHVLQLDPQPQTAFEPHADP